MVKETKYSTFAQSLRASVLKMASRGKSSHIGSCLSIADIISVLFTDHLKIYPEDPNYSNRDRFILSKGHAGAIVYAALSKIGFFDEKLLETHYQNGSYLSGHVSHKNIPGVEISTGSLGHGLSIGCGIAYEAKIKKRNFRVFVLMSDGECDEGSNWESILFAPHHKLSNLYALIDYNKIQSIKSVQETLDLEPLEEKWNSFGWNVLRCSGHDHIEINNKLLSANKSDKPTVIIFDTIKGKGVKFMENNPLWHYRPPSKDDLKKALNEIEKS